MNRYLFLLAVAVLWSGSLLASPEELNKDEKKALKEADYFFSESNFMRALDIYDSLLSKHPEDIDLKYKTGICYLFKPNARRRGLVLLSEVEEGGASYPDLKFYMGRAYHMLYEFPEAIDYFTKYQGESGATPELKEQVDKYLEYCRNGQIAVEDVAVVNIELLDPPSSLHGSEYVPLITPDERLMVFTYRGPLSKGGRMNKNLELDNLRGEYYEDIFISYHNDTGWTVPNSIGAGINTFGHDAAIGISADGRQLLIYKSDGNIAEDIFVSTLSGDKWSFPKPVAGAINTKDWEGSASITSNGRYVYFASDREGGYGGRDIYKAEKMEDGSWGNVTNMGPTINTNRNEDSPFIHPDGVTLFFSSESHNSMGGHDIFYTFFEDTAWGKPINIGYPVNTTDDDRYFVISSDGRHGYLSSGRAENGEQHDIFLITFENRIRPPRMIELTGQVRLNNRPTSGTLVIRDLTDGTEFGTIESNHTDGRYRVYLKPGHTYEFRVKIGDEPEIVETLETPDINGYVITEVDFEAATGDVGLAPNDRPSFFTLQERFDRQMYAARQQGKIDLADPEEEPVADFVDLAMDVVIAPGQENALDINKIEAMDNVERSIDSRGNVRYRFRDFDDLSELEAKKAELAAMGIGKKQMLTVLEIGDNADIAATDTKPNEPKENRPDHRKLIGVPFEVIVPPGKMEEIDASFLLGRNYVVEVDPQGNTIYRFEAYDNEDDLIAMRDDLDKSGLETIPMVASDKPFEPDALVGRPFSVSVPLDRVDEVDVGFFIASGMTGKEEDNQGNMVYNFGGFDNADALVAFRKGLDDMGFSDVPMLDIAIAIAAAEDKPKTGGGSDKGRINVKDLVLETVYHPFDKWTIEGEEKEKMDRMVLAIRSRPTLKIRITSHTDSRGSNAYNERLSKRRVEFTLKYLTDRGVDPSRIETRWKGETELANHCKNGVWCSIPDHQLNRRSEFEVIEY